MEKEYNPAIITAVAGICGIILNICINAIYRVLDNYDKRRAQKIESLESYYIPLCNKMQNFNRLISKYEELSEEKATIEKLVNYYNRTGRVPANQIKVFEEIKALINDSYELLQNNQYYLYDFKIRFYFIKINLAFNILHQAIKDNSTYQNDYDNFSFKYINEFINRINIIIVSLYSRNIFHYIYLKLWMHKVQNK
jgi:hypothetical protein